MYEALKKELGDAKVKLVAVSKMKTAAAIQTLYDAGHRDFGENYVQELLQKQEQLPKDIRWHFIGHLQTNKVKYIAPFIDTIHSADSIKLLKAIHQQAEKNQRIIKVLLQVHIAKEETKFGLDENELYALLDNPERKSFTHAPIIGLMGMATNIQDKAAISKEFFYSKNIFTKVKQKYFSEEKTFCELSMGMSADYELAIAAGSTMVRIGSLIFGSRE